MAESAMQRPPLLLVMPPVQYVVPQLLWHELQKDELQEVWCALYAPMPGGR